MTRAYALAYNLLQVAQAHKATCNDPHCNVILGLVRDAALALVAAEMPEQRREVASWDWPS